MARQPPRQADAHVRKWAQEAMSARPEKHIAPPLPDPQTFGFARRESEGGLSLGSAKSSAPASTSNKAYDQICLSGASNDVSPSSSTLHRSESAMAAFLRDRPSSMFSPTTSTFPYSTTESSERVEHAERPQLSLKSCLKQGSPAALENDDPNTPNTPIAHDVGSSHHQHKSVHISEDLPRRNDDLDQLVANLSFAESSSSPASSARLVRRNAAHKRVGPGKPSGSGPLSTVPLSFEASPNLSNSSYESEEDTQVLVTPIDEHVPIYAGDSPPNDNVNAGIAEPQELVTVREGISQALPLINLASRRPSLTEKNESHRKMSDTSSSAEEAPSLPVFSHSTLLDIGRQSGLTPPTSRSGTFEQSTVSAMNQSSLVSAGLEMGLGGALSSAVFSSQMLPSVANGLGGLNEARLSRTHGGIDAENFSMGGRGIGGNLAEQGRHQHVIQSDRAGGEESFEELDWNDAELNRRRTTGGLQSRREQRQGAAVGKRRVHRTGTQDPHGLSSATHSRHTSSSTMADIEETQGRRSADENGSSNPSTAGSAPSDGPYLHNAGTTDTPLDTPSHDHRAFLSPSIGFRAEFGSSLSHQEHGAGGLGDGRNPIANSGSRRALGDGNGHQPAKGTAVHNLANGLMGVGEAGHFGPGVRAKVALLIDSLISTIPMTHEEGEVINLAEYGSLNSRSGLLLRPVISALSKRAMLHSDEQHNSIEVDELDATTSCTTKQGYFDSWSASHGDQKKEKLRSLSHKEVCPQSKVTFCITHEDSSSSDFRSTIQMLETHPESYLDTHWQSGHTPGLTNSIFPTFAARPFPSRLAPPQTMHLGIDLMDLHWTHTPLNPNISRATTAQAELTAFLNARGNEFKEDGLLVLAYIARTEDDEQKAPLHSDDYPSPDSHTATLLSNGGSKPRKDIWTTMSNTLAPCIQRLVSCGMLKSDVARHLLELPMHPRTAKQTQAALKSVEKTWKLEWSCGLGQGEESKNADAHGNLHPVPEKMPSEPLPLRLPHPAWKAYESGCLSTVPFTEHMIQLFKNLYESHFRAVLRDRGRLSKGAVEFVLDSLWDVLFSRIVDQFPGSVRDVEIEVCVYALRRR